MRAIPSGEGELLRNTELSASADVHQAPHAQLSAPADIRSAHAFLQPSGGEAHLPNVPGFGGDTSAAHMAAKAGEGAATAVARIAGKAGESAAMAVAHIAGKAGEGAAIAAAQSAGTQAISPIIQMIMRMPGHLGLMSSFFEALGHFFMGPDLLGALDPLHMFAEHAQEALHSLSEAAGEHIAHLFPHDVSMLHTAELPGLGHGSSLSFEHGRDLQFSSSEHLKFSEGDATGREGLHVSGRVEPTLAQFENASHDSMSIGAHGPNEINQLISDSAGSSFHPAALSGTNSFTTPTVTPTTVTQQPIQIFNSTPSAPQVSPQPSPHTLLKEGANHIDHVALPADSHYPMPEQHLQESGSHAETPSSHEFTNSSQHETPTTHESTPNAHQATASHHYDATAHPHTAHTPRIHPTTTTSHSHGSELAAHPHTPSDPNGHSSANGDYVVKHGDSLWKIAHNELGDATRWHDIQNLNHDVLGNNPGMIHSGMKLSMPDHGIASGDYVVKPGDNLWTISQNHLGGGQHWGELVKANAASLGPHPTLIQPGQHLTLSTSQPSTLVSQAPPTALHSLIQHPHIAASHAPIEHAALTATQHASADLPTFTPVTHAPLDHAAFASHPSLEHANVAPSSHTPLDHSTISSNAPHFTADRSSHMQIASNEPHIAHSNSLESSTASTTAPGSVVNPAFGHPAHIPSYAAQETFTPQASLSTSHASGPSNLFTNTNLSTHSVTVSPSAASSANAIRPELILRQGQ